MMKGTKKIYYSICGTYTYILFSFFELKPKSKINISRYLFTLRLFLFEKEYMSLSLQSYKN